MDGGRVYGGSDMISLLDYSCNSLLIPSSSNSFHETMVNFEQEIPQGGMQSSKADHHRGSDGEETGGEEFELRQPEKKRRLTAEQVQNLEKNFEVENKLEAERKVELAKELGLQPRQVAIWFQNRRARFKTKQLEKDYESLKASHDFLKDDYDSLTKEREYLQNEVKQLTKMLKQREMGRAKLDPDSPDYPLNSEPHHEGIIPKMKNHEKKIMKTEDASSAKSDVFDSDQDSAHMQLDPDFQSEFSQDEDDHPLMMSKTLLLPTFNNNNNSDNNDNDNNNNNNDNNKELKVEEVCYDPNATSCNFSLVDDQPFWSWLY